MGGATADSKAACMPVGPPDDRSETGETISRSLLAERKDILLRDLENFRAQAWAKSRKVVAWRVCLAWRGDWVCDWGSPVLRGAASKPCQPGPPGLPAHVLRHVDRFRPSDHIAAGSHWVCRTRRADYGSASARVVADCAGCREYSEAVLTTRTAVASRALSAWPLLSLVGRYLQTPPRPPRQEIRGPQ